MVHLIMLVVHTKRPMASGIVSFMCYLRISEVSTISFIWNFFSSVICCYFFCFLSLHTQKQRTSFKQTLLYYSSGRWSFVSRRTQNTTAKSADDFLHIYFIMPNYLNKTYEESPYNKISTNKLAFIITFWLFFLSLFFQWHF